MPKNYQHFMALVFAVREVNKDLILLPNITLGFCIYDNYQVELKISVISLSLLSTQDQMIPGYKCYTKDPLLSVIGGDNLKSSRQILGVGCEFSQGDRRVYPSFFRINPKEFAQSEGLVQLLLYFQWNWVGLVAPENDNGEQFLLSLVPMLKEKEICLAFAEIIKPDFHTASDSKLQHIFNTWSKGEVIILFGDSSTIANVQVVVYAYGISKKASFLKVWIFTSNWKLNALKSQYLLKVIKPFHGALHLRPHTGDVSEFSHFLLSLDPLNPQEDLFLPVWWQWVFDCKIHKPGKTPPKGKKPCTGKENLQNLPSYLFETSMTGESYNIYNAIYALAHALHAIHGSGGRPVISGCQICHLTSSFVLEAFWEGKCSTFAVLWAGQRKHLKNNRPERKKVPFAKCGMKRCQAGERRRVPEGKQVCCYQCAPCPEGTISNQTGRSTSFNPLGYTIASLILSLSTITLAVLVIFSKHHDTPIVKANNRDLTYLLLMSLLLCFLCSFLFIDRPRKLTCLFRQSAFAILFSLAVSSVLAKTVMVVLAFMTTKPGNKGRKFLGKPLTNSIVLACPLIQAVLCATWLVISPPFPNWDFHSLVGETILECNEGSPSMFYAVLAYLGFLALVSFIMAFLARKLPDSFNEAKFITFSMLVFCSVWITFLPTYLSIKGKSMVAVEVFSILASGAGLLACIFFPKCYIILLRPDLNCRENMIRNKNL
uniref:G-protein coupled receptors family 3 profile domain-containing protein n=1 Tax=Naja naja TaxID=35670 RepID=A0A8C6VFG9_NAJNA